MNTACFNIHRWKFKFWKSKFKEGGDLVSSISDIKNCLGTSPAPIFSIHNFDFIAKTLGMDFRVNIWKEKYTCSCILVAWSYILDFFNRNRGFFSFLFLFLCSANKEITCLVQIYQAHLFIWKQVLAFLLKRLKKNHSFIIFCRST